MNGKWSGVVAIDIDGRQRYLFECDKLQEMLGASLLMDDTRTLARPSAEILEPFFPANCHVFSPVSGEIRAWAVLPEDRDALLDGAWRLRCWLERLGIEHTAAYVEVERKHFEDSKAQAGEVAPHTREQLQVHEEQRPGHPPEWPSLSWVHGFVGQAVERRKAGKEGEDARPTCSLFLPCRLHPHDFADEWRAQGSSDEDKKEPRRRQRGFRAREKRERWVGGRATFYDKTLREPVRRRLRALGVDGVGVERHYTFNDLADKFDDPDLPVRGDQYIAFLCADGDAMGAVLNAIDWNWGGWSQKCDAWKRNAAFADALDTAYRTAFAEAVAFVSVAEDKDVLDRIKAGKPVEVPVLPQLLGGDDLWAVAHRRVALPLAERFATGFAQRAAEDPVLRSALDAAGAADASAAVIPTLSLGVAFAKAGYPANAMAEAAEELLRSAKHLRKGRRNGREVTEGCIDWHWIESSRNESVSEARRRGWTYADGDDIFHLTSRPWTVTECQAYLGAAKDLKKVPRRKREQLEKILRLGLKLSMIACEGWWASLRRDEQKLLEGLELPVEGEALGEPGWSAAFCPWWVSPTEGGAHEYRTPYLDLLALLDVLSSRGEEP